MKRDISFSVILYLGLLVIVCGCTTDLEINNGHPTVPVVYAIINPYDTIHYVRVQKTFIINRKEDWIVLNPDSLQFRNVEVFLIGKMGDSVKWTEQFTETTVLKDTGFFPQGNYQGFILNHRLPINASKPEAGIDARPDIDSLVLEVRVHDLDLITRATSKVFWPANIINYKSRYLIYVYGSYPSVYAISVGGETEGSGAYGYQQIDFKVHYKEYYRNSFAVKEISWNTHEGWDENSYFITPTRLFNPIKLHLSKNDSVEYRKLDSIDIALLRPSKFFNNYWYVREHWEENDRLPYTNFDRSYGMFFTIARDEWTGMKLNWEAMDSLCNGYNYKEMKFKNW
jgi:hypothetical protein